MESRLLLQIVVAIKKGSLWVLLDKGRWIYFFYRCENLVNENFPSFGDHMVFIHFHIYWIILHPVFFLFFLRVLSAGGYRIHKLNLCRGFRPLTIVVSMILNNPVARLQPWKFEERGVPHHFHCSEVHSDREW